MNTFVLKIIAIITMLVDHIGYVFFPNELFFRLIGRIAFPIYAFLLAQGFLYTHNKNKYLKKIGIVALISEIPFNLAFFNKIFYIEYQNVLVLFFIALSSLMLYEKQKSKNKDGYYVLMISSLLTIILKPDYNLKGLLLIYMYYFLSKNKENYKMNKFTTIIITTLFATIEFIEQFIFYNGNINTFFVNTGFIYLGVIIAGLLLAAYNTKLGIKNKIINIIFYLFYPIHILVLYIISTIA